MLEELKRQINSEIQRVLMQAELGHFEGGDVTAKIVINVVKDAVDGYEFKRPAIDYSVTTNLRKQYKQTGGYHTLDNELLSVEGFMG